MSGLVSSLRGISCSIIVSNMCWLITCYFLLDAYYRKYPMLIFNIN